VLGDVDCYQEKLLFTNKDYSTACRGDSI